MDDNLQMDISGVGPLLARANLARIRSQWHEAVETCVQVLRSQPGNAEAHAMLGDIYRDQGQIDDAIQWYRMAADLRPNGPDGAKLQKLEQERDRNATLSGPLRAAAAAEMYAATPGGTTQLMGYSPKRWLNVLTIVSACFLAAIVLVLIVMRSNSSGHGTNTRTLDLASRSTSMPTAETGISLPRVDPNRPTVLPVGEQPKPQTRVHQTGDGLEPDRANNSQTARPQPTNPPPSSAPAANATRSTSLPAFAPQIRGGITLTPRGAQNHELPPAPVQMVKPIVSGFSVAGEAAQPAQDTPQPHTSGTGGQTETRDPSQERDPAHGLDEKKPAQDNRAGEQSSDRGGTPPPER